MRRDRESTVFPALLPCVLAAAYVVLLVIHFSQLVAFENTDSDYASAYVLADAVSHGHTGQVVMSDLAEWVPLVYGLITHGLSFHRVLWEISPALLVLASATLIGWAVACVSTRMAGLVTIAIIIAASPTALINFTAPFAHGIAIAGVALLDAYLVWLNSRERTPAQIAAMTLIASLIVGTLLASDQLLFVVGLVPLVCVSLVERRQTHDPSNLIPVLCLSIGTVITWGITSRLMTSLDFATAALPGLGVGVGLITSHLLPLVQGLLRWGNGLSVAAHPPAWTPIVAVAGVVTIGALCAMLWLAIRALMHPVSGNARRARNLHTTFWVASLLCAAAASVGTKVNTGQQLNQYLFVALLAVAATVPLLLTSRRAAWIVTLGACVYIAASIIALSSNDELGRPPFPGYDRVAGGIEALARAQHLTVGYAGYWDAADLDWLTDERLHIYPLEDIHDLTDVHGRTQPAFLARVAAWYVPRSHTPSYLLLAPNDPLFPDKLPSDLPRPAREFHIGPVTMAVYPYDIASRIAAPAN